MQVTLDKPTAPDWETDDRITRFLSQQKNLEFTAMGIQEIAGRFGASIGQVNALIFKARKARGKR